MTLLNQLAHSIALAVSDPDRFRSASREAAKKALRKPRRRIRAKEETAQKVTVRYYSASGTDDYEITLDKSSGCLTCSCPDCTIRKRHVLAFLTSPAADLCKHQRAFRAWWAKSHGKVAR